MDDALEKIMDTHDLLLTAYLNQVNEVDVHKFYVTIKREKPVKGRPGHGH
jgi:hypothetical protein